jgi:hypothetical protein
MEERLGDQPIEEEHRELMNGLANALDEVFNGKMKGKDRKIGFVLMVFPLEDHDGRCSYISNANRKDILTLFREQVKRFEGAPDVTGRA